MSNNINYQKELEKILLEIKEQNNIPKLLMHSCCAPCSSYCLIYLRDYFDITSFFYNPNITQASEYEHRLSELVRLCDNLNQHKTSVKECKDIKVVDGGFCEGLFYESVKGLENVPEGGARCAKCFALRLEKTAQMAAAEGYDFFTTTLTISPLKDAVLLNSIGKAVGDKYGVRWLPSDFKKKGGYQESIRLSREYGLYRQDYCGCEFSLRRDYKPN